MTLPDRRPERVARIAAFAAPLLFTMALAPATAANPLAPIWTGAYIGVHGGAVWADIDTNSFGSFDTTRASFGGHIGYNIALGGLIVGVEADAMHAGSSLSFATTGGGTGRVDSDWSGTLRGRVGVTIGPALVYATAGWAWAGLSVTERTAGGTQFKASGTFDGAVYGVGAEAYVLPAVSVRLEALRYDYDAERLSFGSGLATLRDLDHTDTVVRAGVTLHFK